MTAAPKVSIIISTYRRKNKLTNLINSILRGTYKNIEIIIVDDNSPDDTYVYLRNKFKDFDFIRIYRNNKERFTSFNWNFGLKKAKGKYILILGDDMLLGSKCIEKLVSFMEKHDDIAAVTPVICDFNGKFINAGIRRLYNGINLYMYPRGKDKFMYVDECNTIFLIRKEELEKIGGFNCNIEFYYEESEMLFRLKKATKKRIACLLDAVAFHEHDANKVGKINSRKAYFLGKNRVYFYYIWSSSAVQFVLSVITFLTLIITYYLFTFWRNKNLLNWPQLIKGFIKGLLNPRIKYSGGCLHKLNVEQN